MLDIHHHYLPEAFVSRLRELVPDFVDVTRTGGRTKLTRRGDGFVYLDIDPDIWCDIDRHIADMDATGVERAVLSVACFQDWMTPAAAEVCNQATLAAVRPHADRFSVMASIAPDDPVSAKATMAEIAADPLLVACQLTTTFRERPIHDPFFRPILDLAGQYAVPVFVHPSWHPVDGTDMKEWSLERTLGKPFDMTLSMARLLYSGVFDDLPDLRMGFAHLGGAFPFLLRRLVDSPDGYITAPRRDYARLLGRVWVDTAPGVWQGPPEIRFTLSTLGAGQVMFGSDYPVAYPASRDVRAMLERSVENVLEGGLEPNLLENVCHGNAERFLGAGASSRPGAPAG